MNIFNKITAGVVACVMSLSMTSYAKATDTSYLCEDINYEPGYSFTEDLEVLSELSLQEDNADICSSRTLPNAVDLSTDPAFPSIGNQGTIASCCSWAMTYYTYTYLVHKRDNIITTSNNSYSPSWTHNLINGGTNGRTNFNNVAHVLKNQGAITLGDCPYYVNNTYSYDWSHNTQAMIDALSTRVSGFYVYHLDTEYSSDFSNQLNFIKSNLYDGKPYFCGMLSITNLNNANKMTCSDSEHFGEEIFVRNSSENYLGDTITTGHSLTVVGYDDTIWCDVNGNSVVDVGETGAFKIANSYGTNWGNSGYIWVLYDALLSTSRIKLSSNSSLTWDYDNSYDRIAFFAAPGYSNLFYYITISDYNVGYISLVNFTTSRRNQFSASAYNNSSFDDIFRKYGSNNTSISFNGTIVLNHKDSSNVEANLNGYWGVQIRDDLSDSYPITVNSVKLADNHGNIIKNYSNGTTVNGNQTTITTYLSLIRGDVDYSGTLTTNDASIILDYIAHIATPSDVQRELADYDNNGVIDVTDYTSIILLLNNKGIDISCLTSKYNDYVRKGLLNQEG